MKKVFIAVALVATMGLSLVSCDKDENKCWEVTYKTNTFGEYHTYIWASQNNIEAQEKEWDSKGYTEIKSSKASKYKNVDECVAAALGLKSE